MTGVGFLALFTSPLGPLREFGLLCTIGVAVSLFVVFIIMPPMIRLRFIKGWAPSKHNSSMQLIGLKKGDFFKFLKWLVETKSKFLIILVTVFFIFAGYQIPHLQTGMNMINFFKPDSSVFQDYDRMNTRMNGTGIVNILIESPNRGGIVDSGFIKKIDKFSFSLKEENSSVTSVQSISQFIKQMNKVMNFDSIPYETDDSEEVFIDFFSDSTNGSIFGTSENDETAYSSEGFIFEDENNFSGENSQNYEIESGLNYTQIGDLLKEALLNTQTLDPSALELIQGFNKINNYAGAAYDEIPVDPEKYGLETEEELNALISQYLILSAGKLGMVINDDLEPDKTLITIQLNDEDKETLTNVLSHINTFWDREIPAEWKYRIGGSSTVYFLLDKLIIHSQILSILGALFLVWLIITIIFRSARVGFIGLLPIVFSLCGLLIAFVAGGMKLDAVTSLTASIAIGVGADYAIHVLVAYRRLSMKMDHKDILFQLYSTTGRAILMNALSVAIGFFALVLSQLIPMGVFGAMFALSMVISSMASLILIPAIFNRLDIGKLFKQDKLKIVGILD
ncbi:MAG: MMPL family transporter [Spirochaetales bacterium]|nr:MMPL family transporter [Spirochaetales bacterium]